jgi:hypothetical protein
LVLKLFGTVFIGEEAGESIKEEPPLILRGGKIGTYQIRYY